jgi:L-2-hydroxyglutarate oxidase LhgO
VVEEVVTAKYVVNCAGLFSDKVAAMVGDTSFAIKPRIGEYVLLKRPAITNKARSGIGLWAASPLSLSLSLSACFF